ncbi:MAG: sensor histidine kinase [Pseudomonadota bacterium]
MRRVFSSKSLVARLLTGVVLWTTVLVLAGALVLTSLFTNAVERGFDARLNVLLESLIAVTEVSEVGTITTTRSIPDPAFERPFSGWYWQINRVDHEPLRSRSLWDETLAADATAGPRSATGPEGEELRILTREIAFAALAEPLRYTVTGPREEIRRDSARFRTAALVSLGILGSLLLLVLLVSIRRGLRPLGEVGDALSRIRHGREERITGEYPDELTPLVREINALMEANTSIVERARTHVGNLAHALKTPLAVLSNERDRLDQASQATIGTQLDRMRATIDQSLARARAAATAAVTTATTPLEDVVDALVRTLTKIHRNRELEFSDNLPPGLVFRGEQADLEEILGNVLDNAAKWAKRHIRVSATSEEPGWIVVVVDDDGPGLPPDRRGEVLQRGKRLDESVPGSGLGLSIVKDMTGMYAGSVSLDESPDAGLRVILRLPGLVPESTRR